MDLAAGPVSEDLTGTMSFGAGLVVGVERVGFVGQKLLILSHILVSSAGVPTQPSCRWEGCKQQSGAGGVVGGGSISRVGCTIRLCIIHLSSAGVRHQCQAVEAARLATSLSGHLLHWCFSLVFLVGRTPPWQQLWNSPVQLMTSKLAAHRAARRLTLLRRLLLSRCRCQGLGATSRSRTPTCS